MRDRPDDPAVLAEVVRRLMTIRNRLGVAAFRDASAKAMVAIGGAALADAEARARRRPKATGRRGNVIDFPGKRGPAGRKPDV